MDSLIKLLGTTSAGVVLSWIVAIVLGIVCIYKWLQRYRKTRNHYDSLQQQLDKEKQMLDQLDDKQTIFSRETENQIQQLKNNEESIVTKLDSISTEISALSDYQKQKDMRTLRDRILQSYKFYLRRGKYNNNIPLISQNEQEALEGLIQSYTESGGNSFIHSTIQPQVMTKWQVVTEEQLKKLLARDSDMR